jgi:hypothetical protein
MPHLHHVPMHGPELQQAVDACNTDLDDAMRRYREHASTAAASLDDYTVRRIRIAIAAYRLKTAARKLAIEIAWYVLLFFIALTWTIVIMHVVGDVRAWFEQETVPVVRPVLLAPAGTERAL